MKGLEEYIRANAAQFDTATPPEGHEDRFLARLDGSVTRRPRPVGLFRRPAIWALAFAAFAAAILILRPGDPFRGTGNDPQKIYLAYMDRVAELYQAPSTDSQARDALLAGITEEEEPLFLQLPEELSARERGRILKDYYSRMLAAAGQIK
jgi:hypothetical protein